MDPYRNSTAVSIPIATPATFFRVDVQMPTDMFLLVPFSFEYVYITIWLFNSSPWYRWPIEIDGLPIKNEDFHGYVSHSQLVPLKPQNWISGPQPHLNRILGLPDSNKAISRVRPGHGGR